ncbi:MAG: glycosyltransferase family 4 protein [Lentisphaeria bacterium]|nr:glycosyltransferase family 4 protein [Lentisphaeria bacterium]
MKKIVHVMDFVPKKKGALEYFLIELAAKCHQDGFQTTFLFSGEPVSWFSNAIQATANTRVLSGCPVKEAFPQCRSILKEIKPDLKTFWFVSLYNRKTRRLAWGQGRSIFVDQISWMPRRKSTLGTCAAWIAGHVFSQVYWRVLSVSEFNRRRNIQSFFVPKSKTLVIHNGCPQFPADDSRPAGLPDNYIFYAGQLATYKGVDTLLKAFARCRNAGPRFVGFKLVMAGQGPAEPPLRQLATELHVQEDVVFLGLRNDVPALMAHATINVVPSEWPEAFGFVAAEAMRTGRPLIVSDAGALPEVVANTATIFPKGDPKALADALTRVLENPETHTAMAAQAQNRAETFFTIDRMVTDYLTLFQQAFEGRNA